MKGIQQRSSGSGSGSDSIQSKISGEKAPITCSQAQNLNKPIQSPTTDDPK